MGFEITGLFVGAVAAFRFMAPGPGGFLDYVLLSIGSAIFGVGWFLGSRTSD